MKTLTETITEHPLADVIACFAQESLLEEVYLTPKPGLVDLENNGSHHDLTLSLMESSAFALRPAFYAMAVAAMDKEPSQQVREQLAAIGRYGEQQMRAATGGINTHKGAVWCMGLLTAATSMLVSQGTAFTTRDILHTAGSIAAFDDRFQPANLTNGRRVSKKYNIVSAREEAMRGFPSLAGTALPAWQKYRDEPEDICRLNVLLALIVVVDDTCILHRSDMMVLRAVQQKAKAILDNGGMGIDQNRGRYQVLDDFVHDRWISPGGSADLLAASIFLHKVANHFNVNCYGNIFN